MGTGLVCNLCNKSVSNKRGLSQHLRRHHPGVNREEYYQKFILKDDIKCPCCSNKKRFLNIVKGYDKACDVCITKNRISCWQYYKIKFNYDYDKCVELANSSNMSKLQTYHKKCTGEEYRERSCFCKEYWVLRGYTEDEASDIIRNRNSLYSKKSAEKRNKLPKELKSHMYVEFWVNKGYSIDEAINRVNSLKLKQKGKCTREFYIKRYGMVDGVKRYEEYRETRKQTLKKFKKIYGNKEGSRRWREYKQKQAETLRQNNNRGWSNISQILFWEIYERIKDKIHHEDVFFATNKGGVRCDNVNREYRLRVCEGRIRRPDFYIPKLGIIVEYDADFFHDKEKDEIREKEIRDVIPNVTIWRINQNDFLNNKVEIYEKYSTLIRQRYEEIQINRD